MARTGRERPLYMISVAAELAGVHPQTLRIYERKELICPQRSGGNTRLYSEADIERLRLIQELTAEGINLAGVMRIMEMQRQLEATQIELQKAHTVIARAERAAADRARQAHVATALVHVQRRPVARRGE